MQFNCTGHGHQQVCRQGLHQLQDVQSALGHLRSESRMVDTGNNNMTTSHWVGKFWNEKKLCLWTLHCIVQVVTISMRIWANNHWSYEDGSHGSGLP